MTVHVVRVNREVGLGHYCLVNGSSDTILGLGVKLGLDPLVQFWAQTISVCEFLSSRSGPVLVFHVLSSWAYVTLA